VFDHLLWPSNFALVDSKGLAGFLGGKITQVAMTYVWGHDGGDFGGIEANDMG
jgi:hypothetical protein